MSLDKLEKDVGHWEVRITDKAVKNLECGSIEEVKTLLKDAVTMPTVMGKVSSASLTQQTLRFEFDYSARRDDLLGTASDQQKEIGKQLVRNLMEELDAQGIETISYDFV